MLKAEDRKQGEENEKIYQTWWHSPWWVDCYTEHYQYLSTSISRPNAADPRVVKKCRLEALF